MLTNTEYNVEQCLIGTKSNSVFSEASSQESVYRTETLEYGQKSNAIFA